MRHSYNCLSVGFALVFFLWHARQFMSKGSKAFACLQWSDFHNHYGVEAWQKYAHTLDPQDLDGCP